MLPAPVIAQEYYEEEMESILEMFHKLEDDQRQHVESMK